MESAEGGNTGVIAFGYAGITVDSSTRRERENNVSTGMEPERRTIHHVPGVIFDPLERRALIVGSGLEVFEVIAVYEASGHDWEELREGFYWLSEEQLRAALGFYKANFEEVEERLKVERNFDIEEFWRQHPATKPPHRR
jgi:uncharacterized protein (DUF433 family)